MRHEVIEDLVGEHMPPKAYSDQWTTQELYGEVIRHFDADLPIMAWAERRCG